MKFGRASSLPEVPPNARFRRRFAGTLDYLTGRRPPVIPLVNVALLLFGFLLLRAPLVRRPGIALQLPVAENPEGIAPGGLVVTVTQEGMIFCNDRRTNLEGLNFIFRQAAHEQDAPRLLIEADGRVFHQTLLEIYNRAVDAGVRNVALATRLAEPPPEGGRSP